MWRVMKRLIRGIEIMREITDQPAFKEYVGKEVEPGRDLQSEDELRDLFRANYRGKRYSFGYPACPRLEDQEKLFALLDVTASIGVELTDGYMMDPEGSVSAVVFHHPQAKYFNLDEADIERLEAEIAQMPAGR